MSYSRVKMLPKPQGPFQTGCIDFMHGRSKEGTFMRLYYPTMHQLVNRSNEMATWFPGTEYTKGLATFLKTSVPYIFESFFNWTTGNAKLYSAFEAPVAEGKFPLVIFSHGLGAHRIMYSTICNDLASHGFFVAAVEHRDESACCSFIMSETGEKVWIRYKTPDKNKKEFPLRNEQVKIRAAECIRALDTMHQLSEGQIEANDLNSSLNLQEFKGKIDVSQPVVAGHSFGGATTILTLFKDKRFKLGVPLDPWMFPLKDDVQKLSTEIKQPMLFILTEAFQDQANFKAFLPFDLNRNKFVTLKGSVHQNQSDMPFLLGYVGRAIGGCWSSIDRTMALNLNNQLMINFISKNIGVEKDFLSLYKLFMEKESSHLIEGLRSLAQHKFGWNDLEESPT